MRSTAPLQLTCNITVEIEGQAALLDELARVAPAKILVPEEHAMLRAAMRGAVRREM